MKTIIFYYWLENINNNKETKRIPSFSWLGDIDEIIGGKWIIKDYTFEEEII